jgi:hypothetical protein
MISPTSPHRPPGFPRNQKKPRWSHTDEWEAKCPVCGHAFDQKEAKCPLDGSDIVVRQGCEGPRQTQSFFLAAFQFSRMVGRQELRCSANDGFVTTSIPCPRRGCRGTVQGDYLRGIYFVPRLILYVPFVLLLSLGVVRATCGIALIFWPSVTSFFGRIYRSFSYRAWPRPLRHVFNKNVAYSFYETNEAPKLSGRTAEPSR